MQRFFDVIFTSFALLVLSPLMLPLIVILRFSGEGEVFYKQNRVGMNGKSFGLLKFATMLKNSASITSMTSSGFENANKMSSTLVVKNACNWCGVVDIYVLN